MNTKNDTEKDTAQMTKKICPLTNKTQNEEDCKKCNFNPENCSVAEMSKLFTNWV